MPTNASGRSQACLNFGTEGFFFNSCNEIFDHGNGNVCLKEGNTNFTQHVLHVGFGQTSLSANGFDDFGKTLSKRIEHYINSKERVKSYNTINYIKRVVTMTLNAIFYVFAAVLYLAAAFGIYKTLQEPEPTEKFWIRPLICAGLMIQAYLIYEALFLYGTPHFGMALALTITLFTCTFLPALGKFLLQDRRHAGFCSAALCGQHASSASAAGLSLEPENRERSVQTASASGDSRLQRDDDGAYPGTSLNGRP